MMHCHELDEDNNYILNQSIKTESFKCIVNNHSQFKNIFIDGYFQKDITDQYERYRKNDKSVAIFLWYLKVLLTFNTSIKPILYKRKNV